MTVKPDILVTDIKMPNVDGLAMLSGMKSMFPGMQIIVLTGFRDFEYARKSISLGVTRFLLKPSKIDELHEAVEAAIKILSDSRKSTESQKVPESSECDNFIVNNMLKYVNEHYT